MRGAALGLLVVLAGAGCAPSAGDRGTEQLLVVTTVAPITDLVVQVAGAEAEVVGLVPEGSDSHTFEPAPSDARVLADADIVFLNGLHLEEPTLDLARANVGDGTSIVSLGDASITEREYIYDASFTRSSGDPNPHLWTNPVYALRYVELIASELKRVDPPREATYEANLNRVRSSLEALDAAVREVSSTVPVADRRLLTYHDSWPYFAREYGWEVIGAIQPSDFSDPTPRELAGIIDQIREEEVPVIFGSEVFPSPVLEQIQEETGARYIDDLRDDDLPGDPGDPEHGYIGLMVFNFKTFMGALGGDVSALEAIQP